MSDRYEFELLLESVINSKGVDDMVRQDDLMKGNLSFFNYDEHYKLVNIVYKCNSTSVEIPKPKWKKVADSIISLIVRATPFNYGAVINDSAYKQVDIKVKSRQQFSRHQLDEFSLLTRSILVDLYGLVDSDPNEVYSYNTCIEIIFDNGRNKISHKILDVVSHEEQWHIDFYNYVIKKNLKYDPKGRLIPLMSDKLESDNLLIAALK